MEKLFLGIDGGGTQSRLGIMNDGGSLLHTVKGGSTNMYAVGFDAACSNIRLLFDTLKAEHDISPSDLTAGCFASAGISTENEQKRFRDFFVQAGIVCPLYICADAFAALAGGTGKAKGLIVISGTGSVAAGLRADGVTARAGGLGHLIGDEGSGFAVGLEGIKAAARSLEHRGEKTMLTELLFDHYKISDIRDLFSFLYVDFNKARVASFCPSVFDAARSGDGEAVRIIEKASADLSLLALSVYQTLFAGTLKASAQDEKTGCADTVFSGGILEHEAEFARRTAERIHKLLPGVTVRGRLYEPVQGACILAKSLAKSGQPHN